MNETIKTQLNHRTIRAFKNQELTDEQKKTLEEVARHTSTSMFLQQFSMIHVTDDEKRAKIREITGQKYVGANGDLFIFVADLYRNSEIRRQLGKDEDALHGTDVFLQAVEDTVLAVQNFVNAAESMGLGAVILGSINNEPKELVKILNLPKMTYPVLGVQVGVPGQEPQLKPRLPLEFISFENEYPHDFSIENLASYDEVVQTYYDLRDANKRIDSFTNQIGSAKLDNRKTHRSQILEVLHEQGLCWK